MATSNFGRDTSCTTSLRTGRFVSGVRLVGEAAYRRLTTPRGVLRGGEDEANYGLDLSELVGSVQTKADAASLPGRIENELTKDERILGANVQVTQTTDGPAVTWEIAIEGITNEGPFTLVVAASALTVDLISLQVGA